MSLKFKKSEVFFIIVYAFPLCNLLLDWLFPDNIRFLVWRIFTLVFLFYANKVLIRQNGIKALLMDCFILISSLYLLYIGRSITYFFNNDVYLFWLLIVSLFFWTDTNYIDKYEAYIQEHKKLPVYNAILTIFTAILSIVTGDGFYSAQRTIVFKAYFLIEHGLAYHILVSYMLLLLIEKNDKNNRHYFLKICLSIILLLTGVRSAFLVLIVLFWTDFVRLNWKTRIIMSGMVCLAAFFIFSNVDIVNYLPVFSKTIAAQNIGDITNGRGVLTTTGLVYYFNNTSILQKFMGISMYQLRKVYWNGLHAHNDFVNILLGYGLIFLILFLIKLLKFSKGKGWILILTVIGILAYFNGLFMYTEIVVALPIVKLALGKIEIPIRYSLKNGGNND